MKGAPGPYVIVLCAEGSPGPGGVPTRLHVRVDQQYSIECSLHSGFWS